MNRNKSDKVRLGFHRFFTYIYLPLSIVMGFAIGIGHAADYARIPYGGLYGAATAVHYALPLLSSVLALITLPLLMDYRASGRTLLIFSQTFKGLLSLPVIWTGLEEGNTVLVLTYAAYAFLLAFTIRYYRKRSSFFIRGGQSYSDIFAAAREAEEEKNADAPADEISAVDDKEEAAASDEADDTEAALEIISGEKEEETIPMETPEEKEEEENAEGTEEEEKTEEREISINITERSEDWNTDDIVKITSFTPTFFDSSSPVMTEDVTFRVHPSCSEIDMSVINFSPVTFTSSEWQMGENRTFISSTVIAPYSRSTVKCLSSEPVDALKVTLLSVTDSEGDTRKIMTEEKSVLLLGRKERLESVFTDRDRLEEYRRETGVDALFVAAGADDGKSILCPVCASPVVNEKTSCPVCGLERKKLELFTVEALTKAIG